MPAARDIKFASFSVSVGGRQLVADSNLELTQGCRYGLLGDNGSGAYSAVISGVNYAAEQAQITGRKSVGSMSLGGGASTTQNAAVTAAVEAGAWPTVELRSWSPPHRGGRL